MRQKNFIAALFLLIFTVCYGILTADLPLRTLPNTPDPSFFPWVITSIIFILSVLLLFSGFKYSKGVRTKVDKKERNLTVTAMTIFIFYLAAMPKLGFILATLPFFSVMMFLFGERRPVFIGIGSLVTTAGLYVLFRHGFGVFLPRGLLTGIIA